MSARNCARRLRLARSWLRDAVKLRRVKIEIPELCLVVLIGASGAGKSSFARRHFLPTEIISSDFCRGLVCDDETSLEASADAFKLVHEIASLRLKNGKLTVIDATNVQKEARAPLLALAKRLFVQSVAIVLDVPEEICHERNQSRPDRDFGPHVTRNHARQLRQSLRHLEKDGFRYVSVLRGDAIDNAEIERVSLWNNKKTEHGPFDIIGDVHGCATNWKNCSPNWVMRATWLVFTGIPKIGKSPSSAIWPTVARAHPTCFVS